MEDHGAVVPRKQKDHMARMRLVAAVVSISFLLTLPRAARCDPSIVYDNTGTFTSSPAVPTGFWRFNVYTANELMGDQIMLAGTDRVVTEFDLVLRSSEPTNLTSLGFAFWDIDPDTGSPGKQLWTTTLTHVPVDGNTVVKIDVPYVTVPDDFVWVAWADSNVAGLATCGPPETGFSPVFIFPPDVVYDYYWNLDTSTQTWMPLQFDGDDPVADFGARVLAVPEPATMLIVAAGWLVVTPRSHPPRRPRR